MMLSPEVIYEQSKFWLALLSFLWAIFKGFNWVKDIREKDLKEIHVGITSLRGDLQGQTTQLVEQIKELRNDVRYSQYRPQYDVMEPARSRAPRKTPRKRQPAKPKSTVVEVVELTLDK